MRQQFGDDIWLIDIHLTPLLEQLVGPIQTINTSTFGATADLGISAGQ